MCACVYVCICTCVRVCSVSIQTHCPYVHIQAEIDVSVYIENIWDVDELAFSFK